MGEFNQHVVNLARVKQGVAKAERRLARWRAREAHLLHQMRRMHEDLAERRIAQADVNLERALYYQQQAAKNSQVAGMPTDILTAMSMPSRSVWEDNRGLVRCDA